MSTELVESNASLEIVQNAKDKMIEIMRKNTYIRCQAIIASFNKTTKNAPQYCGLLNEFVVNTRTEDRIIQTFTRYLNAWPKSTNYEAKDPVECFKKLRAHWNRQKAQQFGNELFSVILCNIFQIVLQIESLSQQQQLLFYIDLVCGVFIATIQFAQSMPRPIVPNACFDKHSLFKRLCQHMLYAFSNGSVQWDAIKSTTSIKQPNGTTTIHYVQNPKRSETLAKSYVKCLEDVRRLILNGSSDSIRHSMQMYLRWMKANLASDLVLIRFELLPPVVTGNPSTTATSGALPINTPETNRNHMKCACAQCFSNQNMDRNNGIPAAPTTAFVIQNHNYNHAFARVAAPSMQRTRVQSQYIAPSGQYKPYPYHHPQYLSRCVCRTYHPFHSTDQTFRQTNYPGHAYGRTNGQMKATPYANCVNQCNVNASYHT
eukprot:18889_1